jgi:hypothetical protein
MLTCNSRAEAIQLIAIGDLNGDMDQTLASLKLAGLINDKRRWTAGKTQLIQTGDMIGIGESSIEVVSLLEDLKVSTSGLIHA